MDNPYAVEFSSLVGLLLYLCIELMLGLFSLEWTLPILVTVAPLVVRETLHPTSKHVTKYELLESNEDEKQSGMLCFWNGQEYSAMAAISITSIPIEIEQRNDNGDYPELKWFYPLYEQQSVVFTMETIIEDGISIIRFIIHSQDENKEEAISRTQRAKLIVETLMTRKNHDYDVLSTKTLLRIYNELGYDLLKPTIEPTVVEAGTDYLGVITIEGNPRSLSSNLECLFQHLIKLNISTRVLGSFSKNEVATLSDIPKVSEEQRETAHTPYRVEEHQLRDLYKEMAEIEASEESGSFRIGISLIVRCSSIEETRSAVLSVSASASALLNGMDTKIHSAGSIIKSWSFLHNRLLLGNTTISGARLTALLHLEQGLPGIPSQVIPPEFGVLKQDYHGEDSIILGNTKFKGRETSQRYSIPISDFKRHTLVVGQSGTGKTTTAKNIIYELHQKSIPCLIIDPCGKKEWRDMAVPIKDLRIFTARTFKFNFLHVPEGVDAANHIDSITECFIARWPNEGILTEHITMIFRRAYRNTNWDLENCLRGRPVLIADLFEAVKDVANELDYDAKFQQRLQGAFKSRFGTLSDCPFLGVMFNVTKGLTIPELLNHPTLLEFDGMSGDNMALVTSLLITGISLYLKSQNRTNSDLQHVLLIEEAHRILKNIAHSSTNDGHSSKQNAIQNIVELLREARGLNLGCIIVDQVPSKLAPEVIKLPAMTIIHQLKEPYERETIGPAANLTKAQIDYIFSLGKGECIIHRSFSGPAMNVQVTHFKADPDPSTPPWDNERVSALMVSYFEENSHLCESIPKPTLDSWKPDTQVLQNLMTIAQSPDFVERYKKRLDMAFDTARVYARGLVERIVEDGRRVDSCTDILIKYVNAIITEDECTLFAPVKIDTSEEGTAVD